MLTTTQKFQARFQARKNLGFKISFCETNIRWLLGESPSEKRDETIRFMKDEIKHADRILRAIRF